MTYTCLPVTLTVAGNHILIPGVAGKDIKIFAMTIQGNLTTTFSLKSGATSLTGPMTHTLGSSFSLPLTDNNYYFQCGVGEDLILNISGLTGNLGGFILYIQDFV